LGLKLKFLDDSEGITVPTHAFVDIETLQENIARKEASCWAKTRVALSKSTVMKFKEYYKRGPRVTSPLRKSVWRVKEPKEVSLSVCPGGVAIGRGVVEQTRLTRQVESWKYLNHLQPPCSSLLNFPSNHQP
jgi:hypothetical protein